MSYNIVVEMYIKTFKKGMTHQDMRDLLYGALWASEDVRDILITNYEGDTIKDHLVSKTKEELSNEQ